MTEAELNFLTKLFPFKDMKEKALNSVFSEMEHRIESFSKGEVIFSKDSYQKSVGFIMDGSCEVERQRADGEKISLNRLSKYSSFGILSLFCEGAEYPTEIIAAKETTVLFISGKDLITILKKYPTVSMNVITFLADRIAFLNQKVATFTEKSTVEKLASYLTDKRRVSGDEIAISRTKIAKELGIGRASLYRGLDGLEDQGLIRTEQKKIIIICPEGLERILK